MSGMQIILASIRMVCVSALANTRRFWLHTPSSAASGAAGRRFSSIDPARADGLPR